MNDKIIKFKNSNKVNFEFSRSKSYDLRKFLELVNDKFTDKESDGVILSIRVPDILKALGEEQCNFLIKEMINLFSVSILYKKNNRR